MFNLYWTLGIALISLFIGLFTGYEFEAGRYNAFKEKIEVEAKVHQVEDKEKEANSQNIIKEINNAYQKDIADIKSYYSKRVQHNPSNIILSKVPGTTLKFDEGSPDSGLIEACAETTEQLIQLQNWVKQEQANYNR